MRIILIFFSIILFVILYKIFFINKKVKTKTISIILISLFFILNSYILSDYILWNWLLKLNPSYDFYKIICDIVLIISYLCAIIGVGILDNYKIQAKTYSKNYVLIVELIVLFVTKIIVIESSDNFIIKIISNFFLNLLYILILYTIALKIRRYVETKQPKEFLYICPHCGAYISVLQENIKNVNKQCYYCKTDRILLKKSLLVIKENLIIISLIPI